METIQWVFLGIGILLIVVLFLFVRGLQNAPFFNSVTPHSETVEQTEGGWRELVEKRNGRYSKWMWIGLLAISVFTCASVTMVGPAKKVQAALWPTATPTASSTSTPSRTPTVTRTFTARPTSSTMTASEGEGYPISQIKTATQGSPTATARVVIQPQYMTQIVVVRQTVIVVRTMIIYATIIVTPTFTETPTVTSAPDIDIPTATWTPSPSPTWTPTDTPTFTPTPSETPTPTQTGVTP